ncbi:MAG: tetratricopeptide repeat protein [Ignavibacteriae bacterium]|nr:tetratricopeptide repeat protein [Ignavibacteriota bacterium]
MTKPMLAGMLATMLLVLFFVAGYLFPASLNWGFHSLGFLPDFIFAAYLLGAFLLITFTVKGKAENFLEKVALFMKKHPWRFLFISLGIFLLVSAIFKIKAPLLGDGFFLVRNFSEAMRGISPLYLRNEPLATYYYYGFSLLFGTSSFDAFLFSFWLACVVSGFVFLTCSFFIVRNLFEDSTTQLISLLFVSTASYMQLFFGYVETYSVVLAVVSLYVLCAILFLRKKIDFVWVSLCLFFACVVHYLSVLLLPSFLFLMIREWKERGLKQISVGTMLIAIGVFITLWLADFNIENLSSYVPHQHYLSVGESTEVFESYSQAYTLFSPYHFIDWFNLFILLSPVSLFMLGLLLFRWQTNQWKSPVVVFLVAIVLPLILFTFIAKYDLGAAKDWDVAASFFPTLIILVCLMFFNSDLSDKKNVALMFLGITMLHSTAWFTMNASTEPAITRVKTLLDTRTVSQLGHYATSLHLAMYYHQMNNHPPAIDVWKEYSKKFPYDRRGYLNIIQNIKVVDKNDYTAMKEVYETWLWVDSLRQQTSEEFSKLCIEAGNYLFEKEQTEQAKGFYIRATELTPQFARAYNNLGSVYAVQESTGLAIQNFLRAVELDSTYGDAYYNLGNAYSDVRKSSLAKKCYEMASQLGNTLAKQTLQHSQ